jgi:two-component system sensor histidine kinase KdpD
MDAMLIEQVLMNLLENAVFHAKDMKNLWLKVELKNNKAVFRVEDDGCGIPPERMNHLFTGLLDSNTPADTSRSNMGIGLSVCSTIIKAHGGEMKVENRPQGGTVFQFSLEMEETIGVE